MAEAPLPFGAYLLVAPLPGARSTWRAAPRDDGTGRARGAETVALKRLGPGVWPPGRPPDLRHACLAAPLRFGVVDGERFLASELVLGHSLEGLVGGPSLPPEIAAFVVAEAARGVGHLHQAGQGSLVHRRLGPRTILVGAGGQIRVCGLEQAWLPPARGPSPGLDDAERLLRPPEQLRGEPLDARADVFALGRLLGLLTDPDRLPPGLRALLERACAPSRAGRPADGRALVEALRGWMAEERWRPTRAEVADHLLPRLVGGAAGSEERLDDGEPEPPSRGPRRGPGWLAPLRRSPAVVPEAPAPPPAFAAAAHPVQPASIAAAGAATRIGARPSRRGPLLVAAALAAILSAAVVGAGPPTSSPPERPRGSAAAPTATPVAPPPIARPAPLPDRGEAPTVVAAAPVSAVEIEGVRVARIDAQRDDATLVLHVRCTNLAGRAAPLPLRAARLLGDPRPPVLSPDLDRLAPDSAVEVALRFADVSPVALAGAVLQLPGGRLDAAPDPVEGAPPVVSR